MSDCHANHSCSDHLATPSVHQTLDELDFSRGIWQAALDGDPTEVARCLDRNHSVDQLDSSGYTALHYASRNGHTDVCQILLQNGAGVNIATRSSKATALHRAAYCGHLLIVKLLLRHGAKPKLADADGKLPLHKAAERGHREIVKVLAEACPSSKQHRDNKGRLPIDCVSNTCDSSNLKQILYVESVEDLT